MRIGIVIAIERELKSFLESEYQIEELQDGEIKYFKTSVNGNEVFALKSGYGLIDAAATTMFLISKCQADVIINFGVTGALRRGLAVADLFVVSKCINYDYDVSPIDPVKKCQYEEFEDIFIPLDSSLICMVKEIRPDIKDAVCCSGDCFVEDKGAKAARASLGCDICDMELAAIARTCYLNKVKCLSIKCISDTYDGDGGDFNTNVRNSADKAFHLIQQILNVIS